MFSDIHSISTSRLTEVREILNFIKNNTPTAPASPNATIITMRGMFFVHIYGAYEYTVRSTVLRTIEKINESKVKIDECKNILSTLILNDYYNSLASVGNGKKWAKRWELINVVNDNINVNINPDLMPTDGKNFKYRQLESIWTSFGLSEPILPREEIGGRINEIVELRNAIAHGNETPFEIGKRFTVGDLFNRFNDINEYCSYIISTYESYIVNKQFLKVF